MYYSYISGMRVIVKEGWDLLDIMGYSLEESKLIVKFIDKGVVKDSIVSFIGNKLYINTENGLVVIGFSCPVAELVLEGYYKDQLVFTLYK